LGPSPVMAAMGETGLLVLVENRKQSKNLDV
jgi:hypothetical protein